MAFWSFFSRLTHSPSYVSDTPPNLRNNKAGTSKQRQSDSAPQHVRHIVAPPEKQQALLLHGPRQAYKLTDDLPLPTVGTDHEMLVRVKTIGLNPIDWKAPDYNFGIPELPYISGRDLVGEVIRTSKVPSSRMKVGDNVIVISTDYRDLRKAAYQEYAITATHNACRLPQTITPEAGASLGVAFVASALALGVCLGLDFSKLPTKGPNLPDIVRSLTADDLAEDIRDECLNGMPVGSGPTRGDWVAIWGGSSTTANLTTQLAKLAGLKVISVVDLSKHGAKLAFQGADLLVDSHDPARAVEIIRGVTAGRLRFAIDTRGRETACLLLDALRSYESTTQEVAEGEVSHLVGLTGLPKEPQLGVRYHAVPIKLFHEVRVLGEALMVWLEELLQTGAIVPPDVLGVEKGLEGVNEGLEKMRKGHISGGRLVVNIS